jgi:hypothetical protein
MGRLCYFGIDVLVRLVMIPDISGPHQMVSGFTSFDITPEAELWGILSSFPSWSTMYIYKGFATSFMESWVPHPHRC